jgi:hypothetical protein
MKPDKETFEAIIADLEETREAFEAPAPLDPLEERDGIPPYYLGFNAGFEAAINQIKRKKRLLTGGDAASEETS